MRNKNYEDDINVKKNLKVFVGGLPDNAPEHQVGQHFARYGHVSTCDVCQPKDGDAKKQPYAFVTFKFAADADCAIVDVQHFPGVSRPLAMGFATPKKKEDKAVESLLCASDPCKVFVGGIGDRDSEEEVGDFFSQWGLVTLIYRDKAMWGFVHFATKEGAMRLLEESCVVYQRRKLDVKKATDSKRAMGEDEKEDLVKRAIQRHFHKKQTAQAAPPPGGYPPPGYYPPPPGYYGAPPPGYPPPSGYPPPAAGYPPPSYPPPSSYPPPGYYPPPPSGGYYGGAPPGPSSAPPPREGHLALPAPAPSDRPPSGGDPYAAYHRDRDPYAGYDDRSRDRRPEEHRDPYAHLSGKGAPPPGAYGGYAPAPDPRHDQRYQPY